ncbi:SdpI family protein [Candidatus Woesearchaeota archaeon]|jgi:uncharacterized membrane protein|nr:SdpI family protein [Candidatus Woesearchaeota archaeon]MBT3537490.1 SdpI family protein [Candidatus Woesearchaeota archaeon]MBT4697241.1 SdpI family protein [Candidatus Woesearchaeota archaeon]MBT4717615.1 SdpI family protein [Candidatus Woesearchaeota archaeon]MBT7106200.1 SdpI family protein [Candidatus Woesearchaeota archaeon]
MNIKEVIPIVIIVAMFIGAIFLTPVLENEVPTHWNSQGEVDAYGSKYIALYLFPVITLIIYAIFWFIPRIAIYKKNIRMFQEHFVDFQVLFIVFLAFMYAVTLLPNFGVHININYVLIPALSVLFFYLGGFLRLCKRNYFIGIRTPWTLSSDYVWTKTHKLGGLLMRAYSLFILLTLLFPKYFVLLFVVPLIAIVIATMVYSYYVYKDKHLNSGKHH